MQKGEEVTPFYKVLPTMGPRGPYDPRKHCCLILILLTHRSHTRVETTHP